MIIQMLIDLLVGLLKLIFGFFTLPDLPDTFYGYIDTFFGYLQSGKGFLSLIFTWSFAQVIIGLVLTMESATHTYKIVMWVLTKLHIVGGDSGSSGSDE